MGKRLKVVVTDYNFPDLGVEEEIINAGGADLVAAQCKSDDDFLRVAVDADGIIAQFYPVTSALIDRLSRCKVMAVYGVGTNHIDVRAASRRGIKVANVPNYCTDEVATHAVALILACGRRIVPLDKAVKSGVWSVYRVTMHRLRGQTVGLAGFGAISRSVARKLSGFDVNIVAFDPYVKADEMQHFGVKKVELDELLRVSDYVSCHMPLTDETRGMFSEDRFRMMKPSAYFVNAARGALVDERALYKALTMGWIAGAALDVLTVEPPDGDHPLLKLDNVIVTPHAGWYSEEAYTELRHRVARAIVDGISGKMPESVVNLALLKEYGHL